MGAPQIIYLAFTLLGLFIVALMHGEQKTTTYSFPVQFVVKLITVALLYWGGFFGG